MICFYLRFISPSYAFILMMLEWHFPIESQVGLSKVIASNSATLAKTNFGGITTTRFYLNIYLLEFMAYHNSKHSLFSKVIEPNVFRQS
jgi:hypothetical protein